MLFYLFLNILNVVFLNLFVINMPIIKNNFVNTLLNKAIQFHHNKYLKLFINILKNFKIYF